MTGRETGGEKWETNGPLSEDQSVVGSGLIGPQCLIQYCCERHPAFCLASLSMKLMGSWELPFGLGVGFPITIGEGQQAIGG